MDVHHQWDLKLRVPNCDEVVAAGRTDIWMLARAVTDINEWVRLDLDGLLAAITESIGCGSKYMSWIMSACIANEHVLLDEEQRRNSARPVDKPAAYMDGEGDALLPAGTSI